MGYRLLRRHQEIRIESGFSSSPKLHPQLFKRDDGKEPLSLYYSLVYWQGGFSAVLSISHDMLDRNGES